jgi:hypothetical protein
LYVKVRPLVVVEVRVDIAVEGGRWRHSARFVRTRPDLTAEDVPRVDDADGGSGSSF